MNVARPVHPFPARMAPELALDRLPRRLDRRMTVVDPMAGSGTIPVIAALQGYRAIGVDSDPLAVIIARTNGQRLNAAALEAAGETVVEAARARETDEYTHPDSETQEFINYWFDARTQRRLGALAKTIDEVADETLSIPLWCAFSRLIITKDAGASRARDVSHSRPHRVRDEASFDSIERYLPALRSVISRHQQVASTRPPEGRLRILQGDARSLPLPDRSADIVMTSPPYLHAIDYLRGHRMSLVWMGHTVAELRALRGHSVGAERGSDLDARYSDALTSASKEPLATRASRVVSRYIGDLGGVLHEVARILVSDGRATLVVADGTCYGQAVSISGITKEVAKVSGLTCVEHVKRKIPTRQRYLPPPTAGGKNALDKRMRIEHCLTFAHA